MRRILTIGFTRRSMQIEGGEHSMLTCALNFFVSKHMELRRESFTRNLQVQRLMGIYLECLSQGVFGVGDCMVFLAFTD